MRFAISPEQLKFFLFESYLVLEDLLSEEESKNLQKSVEGISDKSPGYPEESLFRSLPLIASLARKKGWGEMAAQLLHKRPLRIAYDKFFHSAPIFEKALEDDECGLLIDLESRKGIFFKNSLEGANCKKLYNAASSCYFLLVLTAKYLPEHLNPLIAK